jgi:hypothetical protein
MVIGLGLAAMVVVHFYGGSELMTHWRSNFPPA